MTNIVVFSGNFGQDAEIRFTPKGTVVARFSLAQNKYRKDAKGEKVEETIWMPFSAYGKTAEFIRDKLGKGANVTVEGELEVRKFQDKNTGENRTYTEGIVRRITVNRWPEGKKIPSDTPVQMEDDSGVPSLEDMETF